ncbi:putative L-type lectin-domain containing receptor kinase S.4-like [Capsicum annuum]|nr:putative L-type lectin-domain containing receptor kinase S.4-like [Capsicum annuum]KAF3636785.1 putative L-type lectin-domain containing receptor kinase S.4-like [Capsicum annuum]
MHISKTTFNGKKKQHHVNICIPKEVVEILQRVPCQDLYQTSKKVCMLWCSIIYSESDDACLHVCNPITKEYFTTPPYSYDTYIPSFQFAAVGFGFCELSYEYKRSLKAIPDVQIISEMKTGAHVKGVLYWCKKSYTDELDCQRLICFDMTKEEFDMIMILDEIDGGQGGGQYATSIAEKGGNLCLINGDRIQASICSSVLKQLKSAIKERDVIGEIISFGQIQTHNVGGSSRKFINIELEDAELLSVRDRNFDRITHTISQQSNSVLDDLSNGTLQVKAISKLLEIRENVGNGPSYPMELNNILQKKFIFKVIVKNENIQSHDKVYSVVKILDDKDLIKKYSPNESDTSSGSPLASLIVKTKLIIWDEAPMMHRSCFEALDKTLRDILIFEDISNLDRSFGGKTVVLGGDFRQILPVITKGNRQDIVNATLNSSYLWDDCHLLKLTKNMRLESNHESDLNDRIEFAD